MFNLATSEVRSGWSYDTGWNLNDDQYLSAKAQAIRAEETVRKALTTGTGVVQQGDTGGRALRYQFLIGEIESSTASQDDAVGIKRIPIKNATSSTIEWSTRESFDSGGNGFVDETGSDGNFGVNFYDNNFLRQTETIALMAEGRSTGIFAEHVHNITDPEIEQRRGAELSLIHKANRALYWGSRALTSNSFNGILAQIENWLDDNTSDMGIMYDCGGSPLTQYVLQSALPENINRYGKLSLILTDTYTYADSSSLLFPVQRSDVGSSGKYGGQRDMFMGPAGEVKIQFDPGLRPSRPLRISGPGSNGEPRLNVATSYDAGALAFGSSTPWVAASSTNGTQAINPGSGSFHRNYTRSTDSAPPAVPNVPNSSLILNGGNNSNRLAAGTYYYGVSMVFQGQESPLYIYGAGVQTADTISGTPTGIAVTAGQIVQMDFDPTTVTGLGSTYPLRNVSWRIYRYDGPSAPTNVSQFKFLMEAGTPTTGVVRAWDNGTWIPGTSVAFGITTMKQNKVGWALYQLLPLIKRDLPNLALADPEVLLWFITPLLRVRRHHIVFRNIGRI